MLHWHHYNFVPSLNASEVSLNKANMRDLIAATGPVILLKLDSNHQLFSPCDFEIWGMTSKNNSACLLYYVKLCASFQIHWWIQTGAPLLYSVKLCTFFQSHQWIKLELQSRNPQIGSKSDIFLSRVTLKFIRWKTIGHIFYAISNFVHHFVAIGEFKLDILSRNAQFRSKAKIFFMFFSCITLKFDGWPWKTIGHLF